MRDTGLANVTTYFYRVAAVNAVGQSEWSTVAQGTTTLAAPTGVSASASSSPPPAVTVSWTEVQGAAGYEVARSDGPAFDPASAVLVAATGSTTTDSTVTTNGTYTYAVRAVTLVGTTTVRSTWVTAAAVTTVLAPPTAVTALPGATAGSVDLSWTAPAGTVSGYVVERATEVGFTSPVVVPTSGATTTTTDPGLANITRYYYRVRALNAAGTSAWSGPVDVTTGLTLPSAVVAEASSTAASVTVVWQPVQGATGYEVARVNGSSWSVVGSTIVGQGVVSPFIDTSSAPGTTVMYAVRAVYTVGASTVVSGWSAASSAVTTIPAAPSSMSAVPGAVTTTEASSDLSWFAASGATGYVVERATDPGFTSPVSVTSIADATAHDAGLAFVTTYYYRVAATNGTGRSPWSPTATVLTGLGAPTGLQATASSTAPSSVAVTWSPVSGATGYVLARSTGGVFDGATATTLVTGPDTAYTDTAAPLGSEVTYAVKAVFTGPESRQSAWSAAASVTILPATPTGVAVVAAPSVNGLSEITVSWTPVAGATGYAAQRATDAAFTAAVTSIPWTSGANLVDSASSATTYYYRVAASNAGGSSGWSAGVAVTTSLEAPASLTAVTSTSHPLTVTLSWAAPTGASSYQVERSTDGFVTSTPITPVIGTSVVDSTPAPSTTYAYRVRAVGASGAVQSGWTTIIVQTPATPLVAVTGVSLSVALSGPPAIVATWTGQPWAASYQVQMSTSSSFRTALASTQGATLSATVGPVTAGVRYYVRVRAVSPTGAVGPWSTAASIVPTTPTRPATVVPTIIAVAPGSATVGLSWTPRSPAPVGSWVIQRATRSDFVGATALATVPGTTLSFNDPTALLRNVRYYYRVAAVTSMGQSSWRTTSILTPR